MDKIKGVVDKFFLKSKTIWGIVIMLVPMISKLIKPELDIDAAGAAREIEGVLYVVAESGDTIWGIVMQTIGAVVAFYGRFMAKVGLSIA